MSNKNKYLTAIPVLALIILVVVLAWPSLFPAATPDPQGSSNPSANGPEAVLATINGFDILAKDFDPYRGFQGFLYGIPVEEIGLAVYSDELMDIYLDDYLVNNYILSQGISADEATVEQEYTEFLSYIKTMVGEEAWTVAQEDYGFSDATLRQFIYNEILFQAYSTSLFSSISVTDEEIVDEYNGNSARYTATSMLMTASHIIVATEEEIVGVQARLSQGEAFADIASEVNLDGTISSGGYLGLFDESTMVPEFSEAAFALTEPGQISDVVASSFGFHLVQLGQRFPEGTVLPMELIFEDIRGDLTQAKAEAAYQEAIGNLRDNAVVVFPEEG